MRAFMGATLKKRSCSAPYMGIPACRPSSADGLLSPPSLLAGSSRRRRGRAAVDGLVSFLSRSGGRRAFIVLFNTLSLDIPFGYRAASITAQFLVT